MQVSAVRFSPAPPDTQATGLLGHVRFVLNGRLLVDGVALRRTREGRLALSFPERLDREGRRHAILRPFGCGTRADLERQILDALQREGCLP